ncbi:MAG: glycosyltransferase family 39 protein [Candidatus Gastranaerophilales bacterium]|nr:glycosyltransferase family 39 protein [Candidatus Gastranaerophilales bacterium]
MWWDELYCHYEARMSFPFKLLKRLFLDGYSLQAPFYYLLLHFWMKFFGDNDITLRLLSIISGVISIFAAYLAGNRSYAK